MGSRSWDRVRMRARSEVDWPARSGGYPRSGEGVACGGHAPNKAISLSQSTVRERIDPSAGEGGDDLARSYLVVCKCED
ncbi:unnamed protein product [Colias eurytheme]|nr:unnamed protein product [Colias eurytheme]